MSIPKQKATLFSWAICIVLFFSVGIRGYSYTSYTNHNRTSKTVTSTDAAGAQLSQETTTYIVSQDGLNQLLAIHKPDGSKVEYTYDASGNRSTRTRVTSNNVRIPTHAYTWDIENRLTRITNLQNLDQDNYTYDHGNRRVTHQKGGQKFGYIYAGNSIVQKYNITNSTMANATHPDVEYIRGSDSGGGVGGLLYTQQENADPTYSHADARGDILGRYAQDGSQTYSATYKANGQTIETSGSNPDDIGQNTKQTDTENGLVYFGHRYYDPEAGVWLSRDPLGFADGLNLYAYNHNNAWTQFDPDGRYSAVASAAIGGFVMGAGIDFVVQLVQNGGFSNFDWNWKQTLVSGVIGAASGGTASGISNIGKQGANGLAKFGATVFAEAGIGVVGQIGLNLTNDEAKWNDNLVQGGAFGVGFAVLSKPLGGLLKGVGNATLGATKLAARGVVGGARATKNLAGTLSRVRLGVHSSHMNVGVPFPSIRLAPKTATINIRYVENFNYAGQLKSMNKSQFMRKAGQLQSLGEQGKTYKISGNVNRSGAKETEAYRQQLIKKIWNQYGTQNRDIARKMINRVTNKNLQQMDHIWELQLGGPRSIFNIQSLDSFTNWHIGTQQIAPQLRGLDAGTKIKFNIIGP